MAYSFLTDPTARARLASMLRILRQHRETLRRWAGNPAAPCAYAIRCAKGELAYRHRLQGAREVARAMFEDER